MERDRKLLFLLSALVIIIITIGILRPKQIDWTPTFSASDKIPFGNYILYHSLEDIFGRGQVQINSASPYNLLHDHEFKNSTLFIVQQEFNATSYEVQELLHFVDTGNTIFLSTVSVYGKFSDTLKLAEKIELNLHPIMKIFAGDTANGFITNFTNAELRSDSGYWFGKTGYSNYYDVSDTDFLKQPDTSGVGIREVSVLGINANRHAGFVRMRYGRGNIFLHNNPYAFSNYYMLRPEGAEYIEKCLSYLPKGKIVWDEYYKQQGNNQIKAPLSFILSKDALRWAYYTAVFTLLVYVLFNIKRRQRVIPVVQPYQNTSLQFTQTVGSLYFNQSDHKDIAVKKINYLLEFIRNRYNLETAEVNETFGQKLSHKSGIESDRVGYLITMMNGIGQKQWVSDTELIELNSAIDYFKRHCQ